MQINAGGITEETTQRNLILHIIQPGLAGLMDGSVSSLAPLFAAAYSTHNTIRHLLLVWPQLQAPVLVWLFPKH
jgi:rubrerythrin